MHGYRGLESTVELCHTDGRWVTDDYYEEKTLQEIAERGIKPGDLVGDLPDPNAQSTEAAARPDRANPQGGSGGGLGIYRAGGPTTIFGGSGWGPFSDGPLNAVRKSLLSRDGVKEDNWMWMIAQRVRESDEELAKWRRNRLKLGGGLETTREEEVEPLKKKRKVSSHDPLPLGVYEPHTGNVYCELSFLILVFACRPDRAWCRSLRYSADAKSIGSGPYRQTRTWRHQGWEYGLGSSLGRYNHGTSHRGRECA